MSNKHFWDDVISRLDERLTDDAASDLFLHQQSRDVEVSEYISDTYNGISGKVRKKHSIIAFAACITLVICLAVVIVVIINNNNIAVQPLDSSDEYSYLIEEVEYTHSIKVYYPSKEIGEEFIEYPEIIKNKIVIDTVETYLFAGNVEKEYYVFGNIDKADTFKKIDFNDPIGGQAGFSRDGWDISFNPAFLNFVCNEEAIKEFCDIKYKYGYIKEKMEEITDVFMVCIPGYVPLVHFRDGDKIYFIHLTQNIEYGDGTLYGIFTHEELIDHYALKERPITINRDEVVDGCAFGNLQGMCEVNITKLLAHIVDDEFIVREGSKTSYYRWNMSTGEKVLAAVVDSEAQTIEGFVDYNTDLIPSTEFWNNSRNVSTFRDGELYMNYDATQSFLDLYYIQFSSSYGMHDGICVFYDENRNSFTSDTDFLYRDSLVFKSNQYGPLYEEDGKAKLHLSARFPYADVYHGLPIELELVVKSNGVPVLIDGKESCQFTCTLVSKEDREFESDIHIDVSGLTFNEHGYSTGLVAYLTYTLDASQIISGKVETHTISQEIVVRNNPDELTEEELIATNPVVTSCEKVNDITWALTVDVGVFTEASEGKHIYMEFSDEDETSIMFTLPGRFPESKYVDGVGITLKKEDEGIIRIIIRDVKKNSTPTFSVHIGKDGYTLMRYKEKFLIKE